MKKDDWRPYAAFIVLTEAVGALSGFLTRDGVRAYRLVEKSSLTPPEIVFPIVWVVLFALLGAGVARVWQTKPSRSRTSALVLFAVQLAFNFMWSILFFNLQLFGFALLWLIVLWVLVLLMTLRFYKLDRPAAWMQIPYLVWVAFAGYLNAVAWLLNR